MPTVFVAGTDEPHQFSDVARELTELLAATAEAALDRVQREETLRQQERELQEQNRRLSRLNQVNEIIRTIDRAVVEADSREAIEREVCARLTAARFAFAWIGEPDTSSGELHPRVWAGTPDGYLDSISRSIASDGGEPATVTAATRSATVVQNVADGFRNADWRTEALQRGYQSVISVPLAYDEFFYGVLAVYADERTDREDGTRTVLEELGETVASAISALERKNALLATTSTEVEYEIEDPSFPLLRLSNAIDATIVADGPIQQTDTGVYLYASVEATALDDLRAAIDDLASIIGLQVINEDDLDLLIRLELTRPFIALSLVQHGVTVRRIRVADGVARLLLEVPDGVRLDTVDQVVRDTFVAPSVRSKRRIDRSQTSLRPSDLADLLTDRQLEVIQTAYHAGYFESPRRSSGEEVADTLGISAPGFYNHIRAVQRKVVTRIVEDVNRDSAQRRG